MNCCNNGYCTMYRSLKRVKPCNKETCKYNSLNKKEEKMTDDYGNPERNYTVKLTASEHLFFKKWLKDQMKTEKENSLDSVVEWAKRYKAKAVELYPDKEIECWVDEDTKRMHFEVKSSDKFWTNTTTAQVLIKVRQALDKEDKQDKIQKRIYV